MKRVLAAVLLLTLCLVGAPFLARSAPTNTTLTVDGVTYTDVRWGAATPSTVSITHKQGVASIPLVKRPADLQKQFGYDPKHAAAYIQQERIAQAKRAAIERERQRKLATRKPTPEERKQAALADEKNCPEAYIARVIQVMEDGLLLDIKGQCTRDTGQLFLHFSTAPRTWFMRPKYDVAQDDVIVFIGCRDGVYEYRTVLGASATVQNWAACDLWLRR